MGGAQWAAWKKQNYDWSLACEGLLRHYVANVVAISG